MRSSDPPPIQSEAAHAAASGATSNRMTGDHDAGARALPKSDSHRRTRKLYEASPTNCAVTVDARVSEVALAVKLPLVHTTGGHRAGRTIDLFPPPPPLAGNSDHSSMSCTSYVWAFVPLLSTPQDSTNGPSLGKGENGASRDVRPLVASSTTC